MSLNNVRRQGLKRKMDPPVLHGLGMQGWKKVVRSALVIKKKGEQKNMGSWLQGLGSTE
jgi:hypothetical protein